MTRRRPVLADRGPTKDVIPGHLPTLTTANTTLRVGGDGVVLGVEPHGTPLGVRLFRPVDTRAVLVGTPRCAQLIAYRALAAGARVVVSTGRPDVWTRIAAHGVPVQPVDTTPDPARRTQPLLYLDDAPPYGRPPELPANRWTTVLTLREVLTHREAELVEHADLLLLQPLTPAENDVLPTAMRTDRRLPPDALTVAHRHGIRWGRLSVTPIEHQYFGRTLRGR